MEITSQLSILFPLRIDSQERKENLDCIILYILKTTLASIIILEADLCQRYFPTRSSRIKYYFLKDSNPVFHRTKMINLLLCLSKSNIVGVWDTDVLISSKQILLAVEAISAGFKICFPYDGRFLFLDKEISLDARKSCEDYISRKFNIKIFSKPSVGGAYLVNRDEYINLGGENEKFYGWGPEDAERVKRFEILNIPIKRIEGPLLHLYHPRVDKYCSEEIELRNIQAFLDTCNKDKFEIQDYVEKLKTHFIKENRLKL